MSESTRRSEVIFINRGRRVLEREGEEREECVRGDGSDKHE